MLGKHVHSLILAVQIELHTYHNGSPAETQNSGHLHCRDIAQQALVGIIGQKDPFFVLGQD